MDLATILVSAVISGLFNMLFDAAAFTKLIGIFSADQKIQNNLESLKKHVLTVEAVLIDAEKMQISNLWVKDWVNRIEHAAYAAEDLLDEVSNFQRKSEANQPKFIKDKVKKFISMNSVEPRLQKIVTELEFLVSRIDLLNLKQSVIGKPPPMLPTTSLVRKSEVVGRENDIWILKNKLLTDNPPGNRIPVIAIVGIGGVGKTTLAQLLYNDSDVQKKFELRAWVYVSEKFDVVKATRTIYESIFLMDGNDRDLNFLQIKLKEKLMGKRFLIILDNVWNEKYIDWDLLLSPLKDRASGSRIVVTSHNQNVAALMGAFYTHHVAQLSDDDCWSLFERHAFWDSNCEGTFKETGKKIAIKCKGLPLAAKTLGGHLQSKELEEWDRILCSNMWDLPDGIVPALRLTYYYFPSQLKRCFNFCSIFPKGYEFDKNELVFLWMAEGFLPQPKETMKQLGRAYFRELLCRSFFQESNMNKSLYVMHDLVHDFAQYTCSHVQKARHLALLPKQLNGPDYLVDHDGWESLRTFLSRRPSPNHSSCSGLTNLWETYLPRKTLRVLSISGSAITNLPESLGEFIQLRYLDVSGNLIKELPSSTWSLFNLQILLLSNCYRLRVLQNNLEELVNLRHLDITGTQIPTPKWNRDVVVIANENNLTTLPEPALNRDAW